MSRKLKIILVFLLAIMVLVPTIIVLASETQRFVFSKSLHVEEFVVDGNSYYTNVTDSGIRIAGIYIRVEHPPPNSLYIPILVSIWHAEDTELDQIALKFSMYPDHIAMFLEAPQSSWPKAQFRKTDDGKGVVYSVEDLGFFGTGTVTMNFVMTQFSHSISSQNNLQFTVEFSMHRKTFLQLTSLKAYATLDIPIPS